MKYAMSKATLNKSKHGRILQNVLSCDSNTIQEMWIQIQIKFAIKYRITFSGINRFISNIIVGIINSWNMKLIAFGGARGQLE